jgi:predicted Zn-dependent peptidase
MQRIFLGLCALFLAAACSTTKPAPPELSPIIDEGIDMRAESWRATVPTPGPAPTIELGDFQDFKLDNGLQVVLVENHKLPRISYQLFVDVPPMLEGDYAGTSQLMGSMLRRATATKSKEEIDEAIDFIGASLNTGGSGAFGATISKYKESLLEMMAEVVLDARFPEEEFAKVKSEAEANLQSELGNPGAIASRVKNVLTYGADHPYGELTTEKSLANVTLAQVKDYYNNYFVPNRSYLVMVGDLTRTEAETLAKKYFSTWKQKDVMVPSLNMPKRPQGVTVNFVPRAGSVQSNILIAHPVDVKPGTEKAIEASIVNTILGSGFGGRLFQNLREDKAYTYGANSSVSASEVVGSFSAFADVRNEVTDSAITEFMMELAKISSEPVTDKELARTKSQVTGSFGRALESPNRIASYALNTIRYDLDRDYYPTYLKKVEGINQADLLAVARDVINPANTNIIVVGDKAVADKLARFATNGQVNYFDVNGQPVDMAAMAAPTDLTPKSVLMKYVDAIGGKAAIDEINNLSMVMEADVQGQTVTQTMDKEGGTKLSSQTIMMGMVMVDQRYNDGKARMSQQGQVVPDNPLITAAMKEQAALFPIVDLLNILDSVTVSGTDKVDGKDVVVLEVKKAGGTSQHFFDMATGLQVKDIKNEMGQQISTVLSDYRELAGVKFPYSMKITGAAPFSIDMKVTTAKVNTMLEQSKFSID